MLTIIEMRYKNKVVSAKAVHTITIIRCIGLEYNTIYPIICLTTLLVTLVSFFFEKRKLELIINVKILTPSPEGYNYKRIPPDQI